MDDQITINTADDSNDLRMVHENRKDSAVLM